MQALVSAVFLLLTIGILLASRLITPFRQGAKGWLIKLAIVLLAATSFARYVYLPPFGELDVRPANLHDFTHYYLGAKYFPEMGYDRLYSCLAEALEVPDGMPVRDLTTKGLSTARQVRAISPCRPHFSAERWNAFRSDAFALLNMMGGTTFRGFLRDHGFNASPAWLLLARPVASAVPISHNAVMALGTIDVGLLLLTILAVGWGFGTIPAAVATVILTTLPAASPEWTIGSFLRWDWLLPLSLVPVFLKRTHFAAAGAAFGVAVALRVFPIIGAFFIGVFLLLRRLRGERIEPHWRRFWIGLAGAGVALLALTAAAEGTWAVSSFLDNLFRHAAKASSNDMGLRTALSYLATVATGSTGEAAIAANKAATFVWILPVYLAIVVGCLWMSASRGAIEPWAVACLGLLFIPMGWQEVSNYYHQFWFVVALLAAWRLWIAGALLVGNLLMLLGVAALGTGTMAGFAAQSAIMCSTIALVALGLRYRPAWR